MSIKAFRANKDVFSSETYRRPLIRCQKLKENLISQFITPLKYFRAIVLFLNNKASL